MQSMKKIIINADDFGLCESVSKGILECYTDGIVSDFSFLINPDSLNKSVELLSRHNINQCGIHFNLTLGHSAFQPRKNITDPNGNYIKVNRHFINYLQGKLSVNIVYEEFKMQLQLLKKLGLRITHFDTHQNIHILPPVYSALKRLSEENGGRIPIRIPRERLDFSHRYRLSNLKRIMVFNFFSALIHNRLKFEPTIQAIGGNFYDNPENSQVLMNVINQIKASSGEVFEFAVHPGYFSEEILNYDPYARQRETELKLLINTSDLFHENNIGIINFSKL